MNPATIDPVVEFPKVEKMLYSLAWKFSNQYPLTFEEARSEAYYGFMRACQDYDPARGKFSTWVYYWAWCRLKDVVMKAAKDPLDFMEINDDILGGAEPPKSMAMECLDDLSSDARELVDLLLETPGELVGLALGPERYLKRVKDYMVKNGWSRSRIEKAVTEAQMTFRSAWGHPTMACEA